MNAKISWRRVRKATFLIAFLTAVARAVLLVFGEFHLPR